MSAEETGTGASKNVPGEPGAVEPPRRESPDRLVLRHRPRPVTRLNRRTLAAAVGGSTIAVFALALWGLRKPPKGASPEDQPRNVEHVMRAEGLDALPTDYASIPQPKNAAVPHLGAPIGELGRPVLREEQASGLPPLPERPSFTPSPEEDALRTQRLKEQQEGEAAQKSAVFVQLKQHSEPHADRAESVSSAPDRRADVGGASSSALSSSMRAPTASASQEHKQSFLNVDSTDAESRIYGAGTLLTPRSPAQLMAGTVISAALMTGINSDLPGEIEAQVTSPVYDTVTGRLLLIPQGARLLGQYDSQIVYGQRRVLLAWTRLILPDGSSIVLDRLPGVDTTGQAGLEDQADWHLGRVASGAALSTVLGVAAALAEPNQVATSGSGVVIIAGKQSLQDSLNQVGQEITRRNLDVQPTLKIRPGFPVRVIVNKDLVLRPYQT
ncbi:MAG TPA: TrbI/VirB10 family protein [Steroidobacteraceae bacterium]